MIFSIISQVKNDYIAHYIIMKVTAKISEICVEYTCVSIDINTDGIVINTSFYVENCDELDKMIYAIENRGRAKLGSLVQNVDVFEIWPDDDDDDVLNLTDPFTGKEPNNNPMYYNGDAKLEEGHPFTAEFFKNIKAYVANNKDGIVYSN